MDAYIVDYLRTPFGRYGGSLAAVRPDDLAAIVLRALVARAPFDPATLDDVILGCANQAGEDNRNVARMATLLAGLPESVSATTVNRLCGSGMDAVALAARAIHCGDADLVLAGGVESMTRAPFVMGKAPAAFARHNELYDTTMGWRFVNPKLEASFGADTMPQTAENVAIDYRITRAEQDAFALRTQQRASAAQMSGRLAREITAVEISGKKPQTVLSDEHIRADTTLEKLAALKPVVHADGTVTAGNASGINDGAAALMVASAKACERYKLQPLARVMGAATAGIAPRIMGMGPVPATQKLMERTKLTMKDFSVVELNEAFAAQALAVLRALGLPDDAVHVNPNGGAIALGHPLGASGARLVGTAALELADRGSGHALATMCIGVGQGIAMALAPA